jgi:hypothetical protein
METFDTLWTFCTQNNRVIPKDWNKFYNMLKNRRQNTKGGWEPSLPLILAAWDITNAVEKQIRFKEHISWAFENNQLDEIGQYLRNLKEEHWFHFNEL